MVHVLELFKTAPELATGDRPGQRDTFFWATLSFFLFFFFSFFHLLLFLSTRVSHPSFGDSSFLMGTKTSFRGSTKKLLIIE